MKLLVYSISVTLFSILPVSAQEAAAPSRPDQTYVLDAPPTLVDTPKVLACAESPQNLTFGQVKTLLGEALNTQEQGAPKKDTYYVLHVLQHSKNSAGSTKDAWYIYSCEWDSECKPSSWRVKLNDPEWENHHRQARLFGAKKLSLLYIHYEVPVFKFKQEPDGEPKGPNGQPAEKTNPACEKDCEYMERSFLPITYTIEVSRRTPSVVDNLKAVLGAVVHGGGAQAAKSLHGEIQPKALIGAQLDMRIDYPTSNIAIAAQRGPSRTNVGSIKLLNERRYPVDFGFAIPLSKIKELKLSDVNTVVPKPVDRSNIYGVVSVFLFGPVDTGASKVWFRAPQLMYGMALNAKPWDNHLFALGFLNKYVQPFIGMTLTNKQVQPPSENDPGLKWSARIAYGIQIPASSLAAFVKKTTGN